MEKNEFKQLNNIQSLAFLIGGIMMVVGIGAFVLRFQMEIAAGVFLAGAIIFAVLQCMQMYTGQELTLRRLKSIQNLADLFFVLTGIFMVDTAMNTEAFKNAQPMNRFLAGMFQNIETYYTYVFNKWIVLLLIAVVLELYTTHRISYEIKKRAPEEP